MTVGIAAIADNGPDGPCVVVSADKMLTTKQQSRIEHEHPETKLCQIAEPLDDVEVLSVFAGGVSLAENLQDSIQAQIRELSQQTQAPGQQSINWDVQTVAEVSANAYRGLVRSKVENLVLSKYGLEIDDLSAQHQFKDAFFNDVWAKIEQVEREITENLVMLMGGVDNSGAYIYQIGSNDVTGHNDIGYATIGSGTQPAQSEFIKSGYGRSQDLNIALETVTAANHRAKQASGVGGEVDIGLVKRGVTEFADDDTVKGLMSRQEEIESEQKRVKDDILDSQNVQWSAQQ
ncbi:hypothetical protein [Haloarcula argentinensis]|uniref:Uncharacterized protein n=1 Tax=Haloarcula argentinensis TaxID=43776 RepID=A0A847UJE8_HALAR|nr:hypothetical protein [Haloarcula argentinensis]NLV13945.1 hypothetical protein [Haloarcula argentinensis]